MNTATNQASPAASPTTARKPAAKPLGQGYFGVKALIISLSLLGTIGGWGALAVGQIKDAQAKQIEDALAKQMEQAEWLAPNPILALDSSNSADLVATNAPIRSVDKHAPPITKTTTKPIKRRTPADAVPTKVAVKAAPARVSKPKVAANNPPVLRDVPMRVRTVARSRSSR